MSKIIKKEPGLIIKIQETNQTEEEKKLERARFFAWLSKVSLESLPKEHEFRRVANA